MPASVVPMDGMAEPTSGSAEPVTSGSPRRSPRPSRDGTYSVRLSRPFLRALREHPNFPPQFMEALAAMDTLDLDERLPVESVHQTLEAVVHLIGDPHLGLKAARQRGVGDSGTLDYAIASA